MTMRSGEGTTSRRPRVLLIAEAANPEWVSVPLEGWSHARALSQVAQTHLITQIRNRDAIARAGLVEGRDFTAIDSEAMAKPMHRAANLLRGGKGKGWTTVMAMSSLSYYYFEHLVWRQFRDRLRGGEFDLVHRLTPLSPTAPSLLAGCCRKIGVPFLLGPLNGGVPWPAGFDDRRRKEREWLSYVRGAYKLMPGYRGTRENAAAIIAGSRATLEQIPARYRNKTFYIPENGIDPDRFTLRRTRTAQRPLRIAFVGRLVPYKGADMLLKAAAPLIRDQAVTIEFLGDGPERSKLEAMVQAEKLEAGVRFAGWVDHHQVQHGLSQADVLALPSIREFGGAVVLEAMALGVTPIVADYGGPAELVTPRTGFKVPMGNADALIVGFREVLARLAEEPALVEGYSQAAYRRAREQFTWSAKAQQVARVYDWLLDPAAEKPAFPVPLPDLPQEDTSAETSPACGAGRAH